MSMGKENQQWGLRTAGVLQMQLSALGSEMIGIPLLSMQAVDI